MNVGIKTMDDKRKSSKLNIIKPLKENLLTFQVGHFDGIKNISIALHTVNDLFHGKMLNTQHSTMGYF